MSMLKLKTYNSLLMLQMLLGIQDLRIQTILQYFLLLLVNKFNFKDTSIVLADFLAFQILRFVKCVQEKILFIQKVKSLRNKRKEEFLKNIGLFSQEKSYIRTNIWEIQNIRICKIQQEFILRMKWKKFTINQQFYIHLCLSFQIREEFTIFNQK